MSQALVPLSFQGRRVPTAKKTTTDGERMYIHARYVIVLNDKHAITESFENPPIHGTVDCLVVLSPLMYADEYIPMAIVLEIGFRRFTPYSQTEYRMKGSMKRGPQIRWRRGEKPADYVPPLKERTKVHAIKDRRPVARLSNEAQYTLLPEICKGVQIVVNRILENWDNQLIHTRGRKWWQHEITSHIFTKIPLDAEILCAAAHFAEMKQRLSKGKNLNAKALFIKDLCERFIKQNRKGRTEQGDYLDDIVKKNDTSRYIAVELSRKILYGGYSKQMVERMLTLVGGKVSPERKLIDQIWRIHKIPQPKVDGRLESLEKKYGHLKRRLLLIWKLHNFISARHERSRTVHARNALTISVLGSHKELKKMIEKRDMRRVATVNQDDDDIPF